MNKSCCNNKNDCLIIAIASSIVIGITAAILSFTAIISVTPAFLWVVLGVAIVFLGGALAISALKRSLGICRCVRKTIPYILTGILAAILSSIILLAIPFAATSAIGTILVGVLLFSFALTISTTACLTLCIANECDVDDIDL